MDVTTPFQKSDAKKEDLRILLVEDSDTDAFIIEKTLKEHIKGVRCTRTRSFHEGEQILKSGIIDIVMLDLGLPDTAGPLDTYRQAKEWVDHVPVLVMTNIQNRDLAKEIIMNGAADFMNKDIISKYPCRIADAVEFSLCHHRQQQKLSLEKETAIHESQEKDAIIGYFLGGYSINQGSDKSASRR